MKTIPLTQGKFAIVDDDDYPELSRYKWHARNIKGNWYTQRHIGKQTIFMHRQITNFKYKMIDHINHDGLDNRRCNLRPCNHSQNAINSKLAKNNTSNIRGVYWRKDREKWRVRIMGNGIYFSLGCFSNKKDAGRAYDKKAKELFGEFAVLNFPDEMQLPANEGGDMVNGR
jgi:hypothetical protein